MFLVIKKTNAPGGNTQDTRWVLADTRRRGLKHSWGECTETLILLPWGTRAQPAILRQKAETSSPGNLQVRRWRECYSVPCKSSSRRFSKSSRSAARALMVFVWRYSIVA